MRGYESWTIKNVEHWRIDAFELWCWKRLFRILLDCKETKPVHPKGNQPRIFTGRTDAEAETPILWPPDVRNWLIGKTLMWGKIESRGRMGGTEDEMVGWHHWLEMYESERALGDSEGHFLSFCAAIHRVAQSQTWLSHQVTMLGFSFLTMTSTSEVSKIKTENILNWKLSMIYTAMKGNYRGLSTLLFDSWEACVFSCVWLSATPWTTACQTPLSMGLPPQEHRSGWAPPSVILFLGPWIPGFSSLIL